MKRIAVLLGCVIIVFMLSACGEKKQDEPTVENAASEPTVYPVSSVTTSTAPMKEDIYAGSDILGKWVQARDNQNGTEDRIYEYNFMPDGALEKTSYLEKEKGYEEFYKVTILDFEIFDYLGRENAIKGSLFSSNSLLHGAIENYYEVTIDNDGNETLRTWVETTDGEVLPLEEVRYIRVVD